MDGVGLEGGMGSSSLEGEEGATEVGVGATKEGSDLKELPLRGLLSFFGVSAVIETTVQLLHIFLSWKRRGRFPPPLMNSQSNRSPKAEREISNVR